MGIIILFVLGLAVYNFLEETINMSAGLKFLLQIMAILYAGIALAFGCWQASGYSTKFKDAHFSLPFSDTEHMVSPAWLSGIWVGLCVFFIFITATMVMKRYREHLEQTS